MFDRFLCLWSDGTQSYTTSFSDLLSDRCVDVLRHERTFDNGITFITLD